jgi:hypothetical protein
MKKILGVTIDKTNTNEIIRKYKNKIYQELSTNHEFQTIINLSATLLSKWNKFPFVKGKLP